LAESRLLYLHTLDLNLDLNVNVSANLRAQRFKRFLYFVSPFLYLCVPVASNLADFLNLLLNLFLECFPGLHLFGSFGPHHESIYLVLLLPNVLEFLKRYVSELREPLDSTELLLRLVHLVLHLRDVSLYLLVRLCLDLKPDFLDLLLGWRWVSDGRGCREGSIWNIQFGEVGGT